MKMLLLMFLSQVAFAEEYREYVLNAQLCNGEQKIVTLQIRTSLEEDQVGDPIPGHGHRDYSVVGTILENDTSCRLEALLHQETGSDITDAKTVLESSVDRSATIRLCSGMSFDISSIRMALLNHSSTQVQLKISGVDAPVAEGYLKFSGLKSTPEIDFDQD